MTRDDTIRHALNEAAWVLSGMLRGQVPDRRATDHAYRLCEAALDMMREQSKPNCYLGIPCPTHDLCARDGQQCLDSAPHSRESK